MQSFFSLSVGVGRMLEQAITSRPSRLALTDLHAESLDSELPMELTTVLPLAMQLLCSNECLRFGVCCLNVV